MAQAFRNGLHERETFHKFFHCWLSEQNQHLEELVSASKQCVQENNDDQTQEEVDETILRPLLGRVIEHYEYYYRAKYLGGQRMTCCPCSIRRGGAASRMPFSGLAGGAPVWPSTCSIPNRGYNSRPGDVQWFAELIQGLSTGDLGELSQSQLEKVDEMQKETIRKEKEISEKMAKQQETVADSSMVELTHAVTEMIREGENQALMDEGRVDATLAPKEEGLVDVLQMADELRLKTLKDVIGILSPIQAVHFLIAAAELHLRVHEWGKKRDAKHHQHLDHGLALTN